MSAVWRSAGRLSLRTRLALVFVAFTAVVLAVQDIPLAAYLRGVERDRIVTGLERDAFTLAGRSQTELLAPTTAAKTSLAAAVDRYAAASNARVVITDTRGDAIVTSDKASEGDVFSNRPEIAAALRGQASSGQRASATLGEDLLYVAVPVRAGDRILGAVRLTYPADAVTTAVNKRVRNLAVVGLVTLGSAAIIGLLVASAVTRRLRRFEDTARQIADGDLSARVGPQRSSELQTLGTSFDAMAARVEHLVARQRGFAADASHQLRTPLTAMRLRLDRTAELIETDPAEALVNLDAVREETDRMQRLVDGLLTLARADGPALLPERIDVAALVRERAENWQALAEEEGVGVMVRAGGATWALALPGAIEQIVDNYVDNALEVAPEGTRVELVVEPTGREVVVRVLDRGPGLSAEDRARAFDRFWRGDAGTAGPPGAGESGSGLGLAIVRALADASEAHVALEAREGGGVAAILRLRGAPGTPTARRETTAAGSDPEIGPADPEPAHEGAQQR